MTITLAKAQQQMHIAHRSELLAETHESTVALNLRSIAFENHHAPVFHAWLNLGPDERCDALRDRYVFYSVCRHFSVYLTDLAKVDFEKARHFVSQVVEMVTNLGDSHISYLEEWFKGIDALTATLTEFNYLPEAREVVGIGFRTGVTKFPGIAQSLTVHAAYLDALVGRRDKAAKVALRLVHRPYLLPSRREMPKLYQKLMYILAANNHLSEYRLVLWKGVASLHANAALRDAFVSQIVKTYRGVARALVHREVSLGYRLPFLIGNLARIVGSVRPLRLLGIDQPLRWLHFVSLYLLDIAGFRGRGGSRLTETMQGGRRSAGIPLVGFKWGADTRPVLVTRAMGGIGDLLMMTPGLNALALKHPGGRIDFAIPRSFHPIFEGLKSVRLLDINEDEIDISRYRRWINLTDCPAGRVEARQYPNVRKNRIEIFARAMGISKRRLRRTTGFLPEYSVTEPERQWAKNFVRSLNPEGLPVVGVQPFAADSYRNWPYMEALVERLAQTRLVLVFHHEDFPGYDFKNVIKIRQPIRNSIALAEQCHRLVVLDSSFLHFSAALRIRTVVVFGAVSGRLRVRDYPNVHLLAPRKAEFPCYPCWRYEQKPCHLTNGRESICFRSIQIDDVISALDCDRLPSEPRPYERLKSWALYGRE
ncbi:MAG: hypothetical protein IPL03_03735 [Sterolibacteriaceae bacterium]|nr:hypothetical protein [Candidatus Methylophosphatis haderslevensis]